MTPAVDEPGNPTWEDDRTRRTLVMGLVRSLLTTAAIVGAYFLLPLEGLSRVSPLVTLPAALALFVALLVAQLRAISRSSLPGLRAVEALATSVPMLLIIFAGTYYVMGETSSAWFSETLSKVDSLYFTITVFATVGFGDIAATAPESRVAVTVQMVVNLLVIGVGLRVILGAVEVARQQTDPPRPLPGGRPR